MKTFIIYRAETDLSSPPDILDQLGPGGIQDSQFLWVEVDRVKSSNNIVSWKDNTASPRKHYVYKVGVVSEDGTKVSPGGLVPGKLIAARTSVEPSPVTVTEALTSGTPWSSVVWNLPSEYRIDKTPSPGAGVPPLVFGEGRDKLYHTASGNVPTSTNYSITYHPVEHVQYGFSLTSVGSATWVYNTYSDNGNTVWSLIYPDVKDRSDDYEYLFESPAIADSRPLSWIEFADNAFTDVVVILTIAETGKFIALKSQDSFATNASGSVTCKNFAQALVDTYGGIIEPVVESNRVYLYDPSGGTISIGMYDDFGFSATEVYDVVNVADFSSPAPAMVCIAHGNGREDNHSGSTISTNNSDVVVSPAYTHAWEIHYKFRSIGGLNIVNEFNDRVSRGSTLYLDLTPYAATDTIQINDGATPLLEFTFETSANSTAYYGQPFEEADGANIDIALGAEGLCRWINSIIPRLPIKCYPYESGIVIEATVAGMSLNEDNYSIPETMPEIFGLYRNYEGFIEDLHLEMQDVDLRLLGEWSGGGFNTGLGHLHIFYDLQISSDDFPEFCYVSVDGVIRKRIDHLSSPVGHFVVGNLESNGKKIHEVTLIKKYKDGSSSKHVCYKTLPNRVSPENTIEDFNFGFLPSNIVRGIAIGPIRKDLVCRLHITNTSTGIIINNTAETLSGIDTVDIDSRYFSTLFGVTLNRDVASIGIYDKFGLNSSTGLFDLYGTLGNLTSTIQKDFITTDPVGFYVIDGSHNIHYNIPGSNTVTPSTVVGESSRINRVTSTEKTYVSLIQNFWVPIIPDPGPGGPSNYPRFRRTYSWIQSESQFCENFSVGLPLGTRTIAPSNSNISPISIAISKDKPIENHDLYLDTLGVLGGLSLTQNPSFVKNDFFVFVDGDNKSHRNTTDKRLKDADTFRSNRFGMRGYDGDKDPVPYGYKNLKWSWSDYREYEVENVYQNFSPLDFEVKPTNDRSVHTIRTPFRFVGTPWEPVVHCDKGRLATGDSFYIDYPCNSLFNTVVYISHDGTQPTGFLVTMEDDPLYIVASLSPNQKIFYITNLSAKSGRMKFTVRGGWISPPSVYIHSASNIYKYNVSVSDKDGNTVFTQSEIEPDSYTNMTGMPRGQKKVTITPKLPNFSPITSPIRIGSFAGHQLSSVTINLF